MSQAEIPALVERIAQADLDELRQIWGPRYGAPPRLRSVDILRQLLAWRVQADAYGGLDEQTRRMLARTGMPRAEGRELGVGARLTRNWQGQTIVVVVDEHGFRWNEQIYPSLSAVAQAVTGATWSGPRFFGLRTKA
jgi:Protein of unknown function (DUF2924)